MNLQVPPAFRVTGGAESAQDLLRRGDRGGSTGGHLLLPGARGAFDGF